ncbi:bacillithiol biosynthesis cysteine-adding enzyme BshC [Chitinophagaceae bacterium MMS25-I14]
MPIAFHYLPYRDTGHFSSLVNDYLSQDEKIRPFYTFAPDAAGLNDAVRQRAAYKVDRALLVSVLERQYATLPVQEAVQQNIALLADENTFTVCTAHQPNLMTGYLYFIYKIVHAVKLAEELKALHPEKNFVPVYYMGSEDNDLDELGVFRYEGKKFTWYADGQTGAVGRMKTESLTPLISELFRLLGPPGSNLDDLKELIQEAYLHHNTVGAATQFLVHKLFGRFGLVVLDPDETAFKKVYLQVMKDDLLHHTPFDIVSRQNELLATHYKVQAHPRQVNLFYMKDHLRERIEHSGDTWQVVDSLIKWNKEELLAELEAHPGRFSPNVILRGMFQETILPNVAFIGGGAEVAYWMQLKTLFDHYKIFFPAVMLRQSAMWINPYAAKLRRELGLSIKDLFQPELQLVRSYIAQNSQDDWQTEQESQSLEKIFCGLKQKATALEPTLKGSAEAALTKMRYQMQVLEKKMLRAEKKKMQVQLSRITRLKETLFPNGGLQERIENFIGYQLIYGAGYLDILKEHMHPLKNDFLVIEDKAE